MIAIVDGPREYFLREALFERREVDFKVQGDSADLRLTGNAQWKRAEISVVERKGEGVWMIEGDFLSSHLSEPRVHFRASYDTQTRQGTVVNIYPYSEPAQ